MTTETLMEFTSTAGTSSTRVDRAAGIIRDVKIVGRESANGRTYPQQTLQAAIPLYEGAKVNINHGDKSGNRSYADRIGKLRGVHMKNGELFGNLHYNPKHALAEQLAWDAENSPGSLGLSHVVKGKTKANGAGRVVVESIVAVQSVDLVADPATTKSLYEAIMNPTETAADDKPAYSLMDKRGMQEVKKAFNDRIVHIIDGDNTIAQMLRRIEAILVARKDALASFEESRRQQSGSDCHSPKDFADSITG